MKNDIKNIIYNIRNTQVILDSDLAILYQVETKALNQAVKRNNDRFPIEFCFQLTEDEYKILRSQIATSKNNGQISNFNITDNTALRSQIVTSNKKGGRRYLPYVFTEQGVAMLSAILRSEVAVQISIKIINAFIEMRKIFSANLQLISRLDSLENRQLNFQLDTEKKFDQIFNVLENSEKSINQGIFFDGQIFDAYSFLIKLIQKSKRRLVIIDNYIDLTILDLLSKKQQNVEVLIITSPKTSIQPLDINKFNNQYPSLEIKYSGLIHDRFLVIDDIEIYHIGASLKDLGKRCFAFSKIIDKLLIENLTNYIQRL